MPASTYSQLQLLLIVVVVVVAGVATSCTAFSHTSYTSFDTPLTVRLRIIPYIRQCIGEIEPDLRIRDGFTYQRSEPDHSGSYTIAVTLMYSTECDEGDSVILRGWKFRVRCVNILDQMSKYLGQDYRHGTIRGFDQTTIHATHEDVHVFYSVQQRHIDLMVISRRPSPHFISPTVPDLSKVKVIRDVGPQSLHGSLDMSNAGDYASEDCAIATSNLVGSNDISIEALTIGERLESPGRSYLLVMQVDCNLVMYSTRYDNIIPFATGTNGLGQNCYTLMQPDCNLVVYDDNHKPLWASNTNNGDFYDGCLLSVDDAGTITIWATSQIYNNTFALWQSNAPPL